MIYIVTSRSNNYGHAITKSRYFDDTDKLVTYLKQTYQKYKEEIEEKRKKIPPICFQNRRFCSMVEMGEYNNLPSRAKY